jgi:ABC-type polysaccharide/polyol phosphate export permease
MYSLNLVRDVAETYNMPILAKLYMLNPMAAIITGYRTLILTDTHYPWTSFSVISWVIPILFLAGAYLLFRKLENYFADVY